VAKLDLTTQLNALSVGLPDASQYTSFHFMRNTFSAPKQQKMQGDQFQQGIEPAGRYMLEDNPGTLSEGWIRGTMQFKKPLVIKLNAQNSDRIYDSSSWKAVLSTLLKAKGRALSTKLRNLGYDAIITVQKTAYTNGQWETSECVDLTVINATLKTPPMDETIYYHGSPSGQFKESALGIHVGSKLAATQALDARIGVPAEGSWDGTRTYGRTLIAGRVRLAELEKERGYFNMTGFNAAPPDEDYYPTQSKYRATYGNKEPVSYDAKPTMFRIKVLGPMHNTKYKPVSDSFANSKRRSQTLGYYYQNIGEGGQGEVSVVVPTLAFLIIL
jgi:hypothetical protein